MIIYYSSSAYYYSSSASYYSSSPSSLFMLIFQMAPFWGAPFPGPRLPVPETKFQVNLRNLACGCCQERGGKQNWMCRMAAWIVFCSIASMDTRMAARILAAYASLNGEAAQICLYLFLISLKIYLKICCCCLLLPAAGSFDVYTSDKT